MTQERMLVSLCKEINEETFAREAENIMASLKDDGAPKRRFAGLTTTKLRGIYGMVMNVYTKINTPEDFDACKPDLQYLKVKMAYEAGREPAVKTFLEKTKLMQRIDDVKNYDQFKLYCRYAESLVAYFKFYGGKDK